MIIFVGYYWLFEFWFKGDRNIRGFYVRFYWVRFGEVFLDVIGDYCDYLGKNKGGCGSLLG